MAAPHVGAGATVHWCTPEEILGPLREFWRGGPDLDPCSNANSIVGAENTYQLPAENGLQAPWNVYGVGTAVFVNPPFGRCYVRDDGLVVHSQKDWTKGRKIWKEEGGLGDAITDEEAQRFTASSIADWVKKGVREHQENGTDNVFLIPASVDTAAWQRLIFPTAAAVCWVAGRIQYLGGVKGPCPMACALPYWGREQARFCQVMAAVGVVTRLR